jgi:hypothetical protein
MDNKRTTYWNPQGLSRDCFALHNNEQVAMAVRYPDFYKEGMLKLLPT